MTPLHSAARRCDVDMARYLVEQGADINIKDENEVSEWDYTAAQIWDWVLHLTKCLVSTVHKYETKHFQGVVVFET